MSPSTSTHKPTAALIDALNAAGWTVIASNFPGHVLMSHPRSGEELSTPEYMRGSRSWPFDTYFKLRQLSLVHESDRVHAVFTRECAAPWVSERQRKVSFKKAIEYVNARWSPTGDPGEE